MSGESVPLKRPAEGGVLTKCGVPQPPQYERWSTAPPLLRPLPNGRALRGGGDGV